MYCDPVAVEQDVGGIFDVDLEAGSLAADGEDVVRKAEERAREIEVVDLGEDDASTLVRLGRTSFAVVLPRMPGGQVLAELEVGGEHGADRSPLEQLREQPE